MLFKIYHYPEPGFAKSGNFMNLNCLAVIQNLRDACICLFQRQCLEVGCLQSFYFFFKDRGEKKKKSHHVKLCCGVVCQRSGAASPALISDV